MHKTPLRPSAGGVLLLGARKIRRRIFSEAGFIDDKYCWAKTELTGSYSV
jgi:hypothetical protein